jgi:hypothetical protein
MDCNRQLAQGQLIPPFGRTIEKDKEMSKAKQAYDALGNEIFAATIETLRKDDANIVTDDGNGTIECKFEDGSVLAFSNGFAFVSGA